MDALVARVRSAAEADLRAAYGETVKQVRQEGISVVRKRIIAEIAADETVDSGLAAAVVPEALKGLEKDIVRRDILRTSKRIDGRDTSTVRPIACEVGILPRAHGSALFTRGETQALVVATLGTGQDEQIMDTLEASTGSTSCCTTISHPIRWARRASCATRGAARSVTASWPGGGSSAAAQQGRLPLHHPRGFRDHRIQRLVLPWLRSAGPRCP